MPPLDRSCRKGERPNTSKLRHGHLAGCRRAWHFRNGSFATDRCARGIYLPGSLGAHGSKPSYYQHGKYLYSAQWTGDLYALPLKNRAAPSQISDRNLISDPNSFLGAGTYMGPRNVLPNCGDRVVPPPFEKGHLAPPFLLSGLA